MSLTRLDGVGRAWGELRGISRVMRGREYQIRTITMTAAVFGSFAIDRCLVEPQQRIVGLLIIGHMQEDPCACNATSSGGQ
jgi:hypothetical protein